MFKVLIKFVTIIFLVRCGSTSSTTADEIQPIVGAARFENYLPLVEGKKVGLTVNHTSMIGETHLVDTLLSLDVSIEAVYSPEHGFKGTVSAGEQIEYQDGWRKGLVRGRYR